MSTKTISIREDVYAHLRKAKRDDESFSEVIERLLSGPQMDLSSYFGALKDHPLLDDLEKDSRRIREQTHIRL
jgi:predicted CopG family antitoxin